MDIIVPSLGLFLFLTYLLSRINTKSKDKESTMRPEDSPTTDVNLLDKMEDNTKPQSLRQQITTILRRLGFKFEETEDDLRFVYEGIHMLIMFTEDDNYLAILVPGILDVNTDNELSILRIAEKLNNQLKYVKAFLPHGNSMWLSYERQLYTNEIINDGLIEAMITGLASAYSAVGYFLSSNKETENGED